MDGCPILLAAAGAWARDRQTLGSPSRLGEQSGAPERSGVRLKGWATRKTTCPSGGFRPFGAPENSAKNLRLIPPLDRNYSAGG